MRSLRLKFALRALWKSKLYAGLNILGLAIGLAVSIIIYLYLQSELSYDTNVDGYRGVYRIESEFDLNKKREQFAGTSLSLGPLLAEEFDYINNYTRLHHIEVNVLFQYHDKRFYEENIAVADSQFFEVFDVPFVEGSHDRCLSEPYTMVVTRSFAKKYFGDENPVGRVISTNNHDYTITGMMENWPANTHHKFDAVLSAFYEPIDKETQIQTLWNVEVYTFVELDGSTEAIYLEDDFVDFYDKYMKEVGENFGGFYDITLTRLDDIHFGRNLQYDRSHGDVAYLYAFGGIGILILILACINYINMATARGLERVKEAGMRKILGSSSAEIRGLIFFESVVLSLLALFLAFVMVEIVFELTPFNAVLNKDLALDFKRFPALWWLPLGLSIAVGLLSGLYPAINMSKVPAMAAVRGGYKSAPHSIWMRKSLVGFQFCISVAVVITALLMYRQMEYVRTKDLGFNKEDVILIPIRDGDSTLEAQIPLLHKQLGKLKEVIASSQATRVPGSALERTLMSIEKEDGEFFKGVVDMMRVGLNYMPTMELEVLDGRDFNSSDFETSRQKVLVNEELLVYMNWKDAKGKLLKWGYDEDGVEQYEMEVVGVVENFNSHSLHDAIEPTVIMLQEDNYGVMHIRVDSEDLVAAVNKIEKIWSRADPNNPFQFSFLNKDLMKLYENEHRQSRLILYLTYLAIFISFLGLTGLASFTTNLRTREIGIRKVLGADVYQMVNLIFREMLTLIILSVLLAIPLAYLLITYWLDGFAYSAQLDPFIFAISVALAVLLAYLIVTYHSVKVARGNPVDILKYE